MKNGLGSLLKTMAGKRVWDFRIKWCKVLDSFKYRLKSVIPLVKVLGLCKFDANPTMGCI